MAPLERDSGTVTARCVLAALDRADFPPDGPIIRVIPKAISPAGTGTGALKSDATNGRPRSATRVEERP